LLQIQDNIATILAIELLVSGAANFIGCSNMKSGKGTKKVIKSLSDKCYFNDGDRSLSNEIKTLKDYIKSGNLLSTIEQNITME
jgi:histidine ammonia-lyase